MPAAKARLCLARPTARAPRASYFHSAGLVPRRAGALFAPASACASWTTSKTTTRAERRAPRLPRIFSLAGFRPGSQKKNTKKLLREVPFPSSPLSFPSLSLPYTRYLRIPFFLGLHESTQSKAGPAQPALPPFFSSPFLPRPPRPRTRAGRPFFCGISNNIQGEIDRRRRRRKPGRQSSGARARSTRSASTPRPPRTTKSAKTRPCASRHSNVFQKPSVVVNPPLPSSGPCAPTSPRSRPSPAPRGTRGSGTLRGGARRRRTAASR